MPAYLVEMTPSGGLSLKNGINAFVVFAGSVADAKAIAKSLTHGGNDRHIDNAIVTEIVAGVDLEGWRLHVTVLDSVPPIDYTVVGEVGATIDSIAAQLLGQLWTDGAYDAATNILTVAIIADGIGDKTLLVEMLPLEASYPDAHPIPGMVGAIVHQGVPQAALTVQLGSDAIVIPKVYRALRQTT
jgi:hypothetical protein